MNVQDNHARIVREIGAAAVVLLRNENKSLPLSTHKTKKIAIIGSDAGPIPG